MTIICELLEHEELYWPLPLQGHIHQHPASYCTCNVSTVVDTTCIFSKTAHGIQLDKMDTIIQNYCLDALHYIPKVLQHGHQLAPAQFPHRFCSYLIYPSDIDECSLGNGNCEHICTNTLGSRQCSCDDGYQLDGDEESCNGETESHTCKNTLILHSDVSSSQFYVYCTVASYAIQYLRIVTEFHGVKFSSIKPKSKVVAFYPNSLV